MSKRSEAVLCTVPKEHCQGSKIGHAADHVHATASKKHGSHEEAFRCMTHYLTEVKGYEQVGSREFKAPDGPIRVLGKPSRFGVSLRKGKEGRLMLQRHPEIVIV